MLRLQLWSWNNAYWSKYSIYQETNKFLWIFFYQVQKFIAKLWAKLLGVLLKRVRGTCTSKGMSSHGRETHRDNWIRLLRVHGLWTNRQGACMEQRDQGPLHVVDRCVAWYVCGLLVVGWGPLFCLAFWSLFPMLSCISQHGCRVLPQDNLLHFVDTLGRPNSLCLERKEEVVGPEWMWGEGTREEEGRETSVRM